MQAMMSLKMVMAWKNSKMHIYFKKKQLTDVKKLYLHYYINWMVSMIAIGLSASSQRFLILSFCIANHWLWMYTNSCQTVLPLFLFHLQHGTTKACNSCLLNMNRNILKQWYGNRKCKFDENPDNMLRSLPVQELVFSAMLVSDITDLMCARKMRIRS